MAIILTPNKGVPVLQVPGAEIEITIDGATSSSNVTALLKAFDMSASDQGWSLTVSNAQLVGDVLTFTATLPNNVHPELFDLYVTSSQFGTLKARQAVNVVDTMTPTKVLLGFLSDSHGRTETVASSGTTEEKRGQYRTWKNISDQNIIWSTLNPRLLLNGGDITYKLYSDGVRIATSANVFDRYDQETIAMRCPQVFGPGNHDLGRVGTAGRTAALLNEWQKPFGATYGEVLIANGLRVVSHDYGDPASKSRFYDTGSNTVKANGFSGQTIFLQHHTSWDGIPVNANGYNLMLFGHLHNTTMFRGPAAPRAQQIYGNQKWGVSWFIEYTKSGSTWSFGNSFDALTDGSVKEKIVNDYGDSTDLSVGFSNSNNGTANNNTASINNGLFVGNTDGRVRFRMAPGKTYTASGGTIIAQYVSNGAVVVLCRVNIPARNGTTNGTANVTVTATGVVDPDPDPDPTPNPTARKVNTSLFYGWPANDTSGAALQPTRYEYYAANYPDHFPIVRSRNDLGSGGQLELAQAAGITAPWLLYQRPYTEVQIRTNANASLLGSQLNDNSTAIQAARDAMFNDSTTRLYSNSGRTAIILSISGDGDTFDPAHPKVIAFAKVATLRQYQLYAGKSGFRGVFFDNIGIYENANDDSGSVYSGGAYTDNGGLYTSSTLDAAEQALLAEVRAHLNANGFSAYIIGGNVLNASQTRDLRNWSLRCIMDEAIDGFASGRDSVSRLQSVAKRLREFLLQHPDNCVISVHQASTAAANTDVFALQYTLSFYSNGKTSHGFDRTTFRKTNSTKYGEYWPFDGDITDLGLPQGEPAYPDANSITRVFEHALLRIDLVARTASVEVLPDEPDEEPDPDNDTQFVATVVGISASTPNTAVRGNSTALPLDGTPRTMILLQVNFGAVPPDPNRATLAMPVAVGANVTPHAQLVEAFDPATVTWQTRTPARSQSYATGVSTISAPSSVQFDITQLVRMLDTPIMHLALILDADSTLVLHPSATVVLQ